jgi:error-prone DNA polymerase
MRMAKGMAEAEALKIAQSVSRVGGFRSVDPLWRASGASVRALRCLAQADAYRSMGLDRQAALWQIRPLRDEPLPLFTQSADDEAVPKGLPPVTLRNRMLHDYSATGLSLRAHPMSFLRQEMDRRGVVPHADLRSARLCPQNRTLAVAGVVLVRQRPGTASGVVFITLEDETGIANLIIWPRTFERFRRVGRMSTLLLARGHVERQGEVVHVHVDEMETLDELTPELEASSRDFH